MNKVSNKIKVLIIIVACVLAGVNPDSCRAQHITKGEYVLEKPYSTYVPSFKNDGKHIRIDNVILMIGDGMGTSHVASAMYSNRGKLNITNLKHIGFVRTQSASDFTTDSAASGTAYATGYKTHNKAIGVDLNDNIIESLTDKLSAKGYATGILTTDYMDGATPSAFYAHSSDRGNSHQIWSCLPLSPLNFAAAGCHDALEALPDSIKNAIKASYDVVFSLDNVPATKRLAYFPERGESDSVNNPQRNNYLPKTTEYAIKYLDSISRKGFFLLVEGARIDKSSHDNDYQAMIRETHDFDKAVEAAVRFAEKDGHTLVIISADHETGGLVLRSGDMEKGKVVGVFTSGSHSPIFVPIFAYGPWSDRFIGVQENSDVSNKIFELLGK